MKRSENGVEWEPSLLLFLFLVEAAATPGVEFGPTAKTGTGEDEAETAETAETMGAVEEGGIAVAETGVMVTWFSATAGGLEARAADTSVARAGKATAPPEKVTTPSMEEVVTTLDDVVATVVMDDAVSALLLGGKLRLVTVTPPAHWTISFNIISIQ